jgi:hypothetical protein
MRRAALCLGAALLAATATPSSAGTSWETYQVHALPDPTQDSSPYGLCGAADAYVAGQDIGYDARRLRVPAGTLNASIVPELNVFAGDVGLSWTLRVYDRSMHEVARSSGPAWRTTVSHRFAKAQQVWLVACNSHGHPDAYVSYRTR